MKACARILCKQLAIKVLLILVSLVAQFSVLHLGRICLVYTSSFRLVRMDSNRSLHDVDCEIVLNHLGCLYWSSVSSFSLVLLLFLTEAPSTELSFSQVKHGNLSTSTSLAHSSSERHGWLMLRICVAYF